ncbi:hypothetical protein [uncultured Campylobacter sp.]|uniref:hypothetical protein n=1 Tax=uncultured Campylobacter sp. TaxID=218934 RepID=UPI0026067735|nr:hypothetical protein [uncultured Campylobacter sp.]
MIDKFKRACGVARFKSRLNHLALAGSAPLNLTKTAQSASVNLKFKACQNLNGELHIRSYEILRRRKQANKLQSG